MSINFPKRMKDITTDSVGPINTKYKDIPRRIIVKLLKTKDKKKKKIIKA